MAISLLLSTLKKDALGSEGVPGKIASTFMTSSVFGPRRQETPPNPSLGNQTRRGEPSEVS
jgi:hypothetical protein